MTFNKKTTRNLRRIIEEDGINIENIYRVYYKNSNIPLFLNTQNNSFENADYNLEYGINEYHNLYLIPNCKSSKKINHVNN